MSFADFPEQHRAVELLQKSLKAGRLAHAYLFGGEDLETLEGVARTLAKTLNCTAPRARGQSGQALDSCDGCPSCRRIDGFSHPDVQWVRPESKLRVIVLDQMREVMQLMSLKPLDAACKVAVLSAADRLNTQAANAFLKTLEEPPPRSVMVLLTTEPQQILETILSRCQRLTFAGAAGVRMDGGVSDWLGAFAEQASASGQGTLVRYKLLDRLLARLEALRKEIESEWTARSPLQRFEEVDSKVRERWETELNASIEAEYRRKRGELLAALQWWLRDIWVLTLGVGDDLLAVPSVRAATEAVARRIGSSEAVENLSLLERTLRLLRSNVQEALILEVALLKVKL